MIGLILKTNKTNYIVSEIVNIEKTKKNILIDLNNGKSIGSENHICLKNMEDINIELKKRNETILCVEK